MQPEVNIDFEPEAKRPRVISKLPRNWQKLSLEEIHAHYHEEFLPPTYPDVKFENENVVYPDNIILKYEEMNYIVYKDIDGESCARLLDDVSGALGAYSSKFQVRRPLSCIYKGEYYRVLGAGVMSADVQFQYQRLLQHPKIPDSTERKLAVGSLDKIIFSTSKLTKLWARAIASGIIVDMDLKTISYIDKTRIKANESNYDLLRGRAVNALCKHIL